MSQFIREIEPGVELFRDAVTGIAWAEDHRTGLGVSVHPNIDESGSVEGMVARGWWRSSDRVARSHGWIYNIDRLSYNKDDPVEVAVAAECKCTACMERRTEKDTRRSCSMAGRKEMRAYITPSRWKTPPERQTMKKSPRS